MLIPLSINVFLLKWNFYSISVQVVAWGLLVIFASVSAAAWAAWAAAGGPANPATNQIWLVAGGAGNLGIAQLVIMLVGYIVAKPQRVLRHLLTPIVLPWTFLDAFGIDTVTTLGVALAHVVARTRGIIGRILRPILPLVVGILGSSVIAAARWMGWKVPVIAARLLTPAAVVLGIHHRFLIVALVTLTWIGQRLKRWPKFALSSIATVISAVIVALVTARSVRRLLLDAAVIAGAFPWMKAQKLERLALGLMISAVVTVFVGVPLLLVSRKLAKPWRILAKVSLLTIAVTFSAAALTIVPGVAGAIILFLSVATFLSMVATHPRVLLAPLAALLTAVSGLVLAGAFAFIAAGTPVRVGRRLFRRLRVAGLVAVSYTHL